MRTNFSGAFNFPTASPASRRRKDSSFREWFDGVLSVRPLRNIQADHPIDNANETKRA
jgi:hypothetical protein